MSGDHSLCVAHMPHASKSLVRRLERVLGAFVWRHDDQAKVIFESTSDGNCVGHGENESCAPSAMICNHKGDKYDHDLFFSFYSGQMEPSPSIYGVPNAHCLSLNFLKNRDFDVGDYQCHITSV